MNQSKVVGADHAGSGVPLALLMVFLSIVSVQFGSSLAKMVIQTLGPAGTMAMRLLVGCLVLVIAFKPWRIRKDQLFRKSLLFYGIAMGGMNLSFYEAIQDLPIGIAVAIEFTGPLLVAICSSRRLLDFAWILLACVGLYLLLPIHDASVAQLSWRGIGFALLAGMGWALYIVCGRVTGGRIGTQGVAVGMVISCLIYCPFGFSALPWSQFSLPVLWLCLGIGVMSTAIPYSLEIIAMPRLPQRTFGVLMSLEPAFGALAGLVMLHETLGWMEWGALLAIMLASAGTTLSARQTPVS